MSCKRDHDVVHFSTQGGIDVEANWDKVTSMEVPLSASDNFDFAGKLPKNLSVDRDKVGRFLKTLYKFFAQMDFSFLEINPFAVVNGQFIPLDCVAKMDDTAQFKHEKDWGKLEFPAPFGRKLSAEENFIKELDEKTGASLKLTVLNPDGNIWTMVAGGGASVIYTDTIVDLGHQQDLANYGEYSGDPSEEFTYLYAKTVLDLMTRKKDAKGRNKYLIIGGGIANFTDVAKTFSGIIKALKEFKDKLIAAKVKIFVRRGGPNYEEGLRKMRDLGQSLGVPIDVYGPDLHMTKVVSMALAEQEGK
jgi:ATP-citrate lyase beta-subunit